jgi:hypothetical protein
MASNVATPPTSIGRQRGIIVRPAWCRTSARQRAHGKATATTNTSRWRRRAATSTAAAAIAKTANPKVACCDGLGRPMRFAPSVTISVSEGASLKRDGGYSSYSSARLLVDAQPCQGAFASAESSARVGLKGWSRRACTCVSKKHLCRIDSEWTGAARLTHARIPRGGNNPSPALVGLSPKATRAGLRREPWIGDGKPTRLWVDFTPANVAKGPGSCGPNGGTEKQDGCSLWLGSSAWRR